MDDKKFKYSIAYIVPFFGKLRSDIEIWLLSVKYNPTVNWIIYTDDYTEYLYPPNVKVVYTTFEDIRNKIQSLFDFKITLNTPYKLCDYRVTYGETFADDLESYDFWGYCDMDLMWGGVRNFITDDILEKYDKIGFQGHSTIYRNNLKNNARYRNKFKGIDNFVEVFTSNRNWNFDEKGINGIFNRLNIPFYFETSFSTLAQYRYNFKARYWPKDNKSMNKHVIYSWKDGRLFHISADKSQIKYTEIMYVHWQKRNMEIFYDSQKTTYLIVPNRVYPANNFLSYENIMIASKPHWLLYFRNLLHDNKNKSFINKIKLMKRWFFYNKRVLFENDKKQDIDG